MLDGARSFGHYDNSASVDRPLRIGYVSGDFRNHAVAWFMTPVLEQHDRQKFHVYCYSNFHKVDSTTTMLQHYATGWRQIENTSDRSAADLVRKDGIDILIDLSGHTRGGRLGLFAYKPAPVQMTYLGYLNTTGMPTIDYRITDALGDPFGQSERYHVEKLLRLPDCMWCYAPHQRMPDVSALPAGTGGHITFGSFNNSMKLNPELIELWARVLGAAPSARLIIAGVPSGKMRERIHEEFAMKRVDPGRVELLGRLPMHGFWRLYHRVDVALDSFPCNGGTTTFDSLWMGVPVVSQCGDRFASRAGFSILSNAGLNDLVAFSDEEYVAIAASWARDLDRLRAVRAGMRDRLRASPLLDSARFTRNLEHLYRQAWHEWCRSRQS
jgi:predicted O-linked N-acetylglucosamine transferase (SPINDLY family)